MKVGLLCGREYAFPPAFLDRVNELGKPHGITGEFVAGDVVDLVGPHGAVVARGVVGFDAAELPAMIGKRSRDLPPEQRREVVHADDLVPLG